MPLEPLAYTRPCKVHFVTLFREDTISLHPSLVPRERKVTHLSLVAKERRESGNEVDCVPDYLYSTMINKTALCLINSFTELAFTYLNN